MDVIIPYGINYKKCGKKSYSEFKRTQIIPYLEKNILDKNSELSMNIIAEMHCSCYFNDIHNFIISFYSKYLILSNLRLGFFIDENLKKIEMLLKIIPKKNKNLALINSNELRNIYCTIITKFIEGNNQIINIKLEKKFYTEEVFLIHSNIKDYTLIEDNNHNALSTNMSRGIREILFFLKIEIDELNMKTGYFINMKNIEKILYWIHWVIKIESMEKKYNIPEYIFISKYSALIGKKMNWILFVWDKIWQKCEKNKYINKQLLKSLTNLFYYKKENINERCGIIAVALLVSLSPIKINTNRKISKLEIFTSLNINKFYQNISISQDDNKNYLESYNNYNKPANSNEIIKTSKLSKIDNKMDFLRDYLPKINSTPKSSQDKKNVLDYFSTE